MSEVQETLGQRLKAERERKGLSAQKAADQLHLDGWVIDALESGDYARIGPTVYGRGHLKRYAGLLGLPPAEILEAYDTRSAASAPTAQSSTSLMRTSVSSDRALPWLFIAGIAVVAAIVAVVLWLRPWQPHAAANASSIAEGGARSSGISREPAAADHRDEDGGPPAGGAMVAGATGGSATAPGARGAVLVDSSPAVIAAGEADSTVGAGRARLRLSFSADSWVDVHDAAGRRLFAGYGRANSVKTIAGPAPLQVYLGFASGVQLEVNNHVIAIGPQFVAGDVAHFEAGADGVLRPGRVPAANPHPRG